MLGLGCRETPLQLLVKTIIISIKQSGMINKKLSDLFLRKQSRKEEQKQMAYFDESSFTCKILSNGVNTDLIRIQTQLVDTGLPLDEIKCKWYIKNSHDFREIEEVTSSYYQPCLDDVGSIICVQVEPFLEGKKYNGITIMEETQIIEIDSQLQQQLDVFLSQNSIKMDARIQAIYSQNPKFEDVQLPLEVKVHLTRDSITFIAADTLLEQIMITQDYPNIEFIRKTFSSLIFNYNERQSMKLSLQNNSLRDLFALIVRTCAAHSSPAPEGINPELDAKQLQEQPGQQDKQAQPGQTEAVVDKPEIKEAQESLLEKVIAKSPSISPVISSAQSLEGTSKSSKDIEEKGKKEEKEGKKLNTLFVLKLDEVNKDLKALRRKYELLEQNYTIEKQGKCQAQSELQNLRRQNEAIRKERDQALMINRKVKQLKEDNQFYKNEIFIIKRDWKEEKEKRISLERKLAQMASEKNLELEDRLKEMETQRQEWNLLKSQSESRCEKLENQLDRLKEEFEKIENLNQMLKKKLTSLVNEKGLERAEISQKGNDSRGSHSQEKIKELQMKLKNLQMLLKYKSTHGDQGNSGFQLLVSKLTETITEKQLQVNELRKVNKSLLQQLKEAKRGK